MIRRCRIPRYLHPNHIYSVWAHMILLVIRQHESKSYRRSVQLPEERVGIQEYPGLSGIPHHATMQKATARLQGSLLHKMLQEFLLYKKVRLALAGIDGSGFSHSTASHHCTKRIQLRRNFLKVVVCADMSSQLTCSVMLHHSMQHDNPGFLPLPYKTNSIAPVDIALGDMGFDDENSHAGAKDVGAAAIIPTRLADVPIYRTSGIHRKGMKRNFPESLYHQRTKSETIFFVVKRMMSGDI